MSYFSALSILPYQHVEGLEEPLISEFFTSYFHILHRVLVQILGQFWYHIALRERWFNWKQWVEEYRSQFWNRVLLDFSYHSCCRLQNPRTMICLPDSALRWNWGYIFLLFPEHIWCLYLWFSYLRWFLSVGLCVPLRHYFPQLTGFIFSWGKQFSWHYFRPYLDR